MSNNTTNNTTNAVNPFYFLNRYGRGDANISEYPYQSNDTANIKKYDVCCLFCDYATTNVIQDDIIYNPFYICDRCKRSWRQEDKIILLERMLYHIHKASYNIDKLSNKLYNTMYFLKNEKFIHDFQIKRDEILIYMENNIIDGYNGYNTRYNTNDHNSSYVFKYYFDLRFGKRFDIPKKKRLVPDELFKIE